LDVRIISIFNLIWLIHAMSNEKMNLFADESKVVNFRPYLEQNKSAVNDQIPLTPLEKRNRKIEISGRADIDIIFNRIKKIKKKAMLTNYAYGLTSCLIIAAIFLYF
jgi:hypothetical protein